MPSFTDTSHGYVQWQSARRHAKQLAQDAAIDIIDHYNRVVLNGDRGGHRHNGLPNGSSATTEHGAYTVTEEESLRLSKKNTPRGQSKKTTTLRAERVDQKGGVFTEGLSSLSKQFQYPLSLKRNDIISNNQPDTIKMAREKSRIYLAISHPVPGLSVNNKGDQSAKSVRTLPPPNSYPWGDTLSITEIVRSKTFTMDERTGLSTRSTLDSRQAASDVHPVSDRKVTTKQITQLPMFYPSITGAPPNTPLQMPLPYRPKVPSVNIVSLDGQTVNDNAKKSESKSRLPVPFQRNLMSSPVMNSESKASGKPGIDLPYLPLRYADSRDASLQFTPRERPARANYFMHTKGRRRAGIGHMKNSKIKSVTTADLEKEDVTDLKTAVTDPYANRFQQTSTVTSLGEVHVPVIPRSAEDQNNNADADSKQVALPESTIVMPETTIMLTVEEEDESAGKGSPSAGPSVPRTETRPCPPDQQPTLGVTPQAVLDHQVKNRTHSLVSNASLLSVPMNVKELSEARPPSEPQAADATDVVTLEIPEVAQEVEEAENVSDPFLEPPVEEQPAVASPEIASTSMIDTARTIATQTSLPFDPDAVDVRGTVVKIKTLSMFPDINNGHVDGLGGASDRPGSQGISEPLLRMTHGVGSGDGRLLGLPELKGASTLDRPIREEEVGALGRKSSGVQNMTFISPLEGQQKAKRF